MEKTFKLIFLPEKIPLPCAFGPVSLEMNDEELLTESHIFMEKIPLFFLCCAYTGETKT